VSDELPLEELKKIITRQRPYASIREGGTKGQKELGVLQDLLQSMQRAGEERYHDPKLAIADPPDCTARTRSGALVAVEISEFVSQAAIEFNAQTQRELGRRPGITETVVHQWTGPAFLAALGAILARKDTRVFKDGPYQEVVVVIHTDEPLLVRQTCEAWLADHEFGPFNTLTRGYFLYPYEPPSGYPYHSLFGAT